MSIASGSPGSWTRSRRARIRWRSCIAGYAALGAAHPEAKNVKDEATRHRLFPLALAETLELGSRAIARHAGKAPADPQGDTYARRFVTACGETVDTSRGDDALEVFGRALEVLFILHADHELNAGTQRDACDRLGGDGFVQLARGRGGCAVRAVARRGQRGGASDADGDRRRLERAGVPRPRDEPRTSPERFRPSRLQELRPAREGDQGGGGRGARDRRTRSTARDRAGSSSAGRSRRSTSSRASSIQTSTSTPASRTRRSDSTRRRSRSSSRSRVPSAGCATDELMSGTVPDHPSGSGLRGRGRAIGAEALVAFGFRGAGA